MAGLIETRGLGKTYGKKAGAKKAVSDVDLTIEQGDMYVLMGLSGSGKSTVLRMLNRLIEPTEGQVLLDGTDLAALGPTELREVRNRRISMVFQHFALFPHRTVRDNAAYGLSLRGTNRRVAADRAQQSLELVGLGEWGDARPSELSGGMKQRVGLARALSTDADILLMDEPFSALDPLIRREMQDLLITLTGQLNRTVVFVTHDLNEAMRLGDKITLLTGGRVAQTGTTLEILSNPADDYVRKFISEVDRMRVLTVADIMGPAGDASAADDLVRLSPEQTLQETARSFRHSTVTTLPVVADGRLVGQVTASDVFGAVAEQGEGRLMSATTIAYEIDLGTPASDAVDWLLENWGGFFDAIGDFLGSVVEGLSDVLEAAPPLVMIIILSLIPVLFRRWGIALFSVLAFLLVQQMGLWTETMQSLAVVLVATVVALAIGLPLGVLAARHRAVSAGLRPILDLMQTTPPFVYLIPAVFFFGVGTVPGVVATAVFALAPAVRLTELGIRHVDAEVVEAAQAFGARPMQLLRDVQLPLALPSIMAGVNQVIMLALSMVVVAGLAGAEGLGAVVTSAVTQLDIGAGVEGGLAVVILAIYLDRVTGALADPRSRWRWGRRQVSATVSEEAPIEPAVEPTVVAPVR